MSINISKQESTQESNHSQSIWVRSENDIWVLAEIQRILKDSYIISYPNQTNSLTVLKTDTLEVCNVNISDLTQMIHLNEANILEALLSRYDKDDIYTQTGEVLLAINPFKSLKIYNLEDVKITLADKSPHVYHSAQLCLDRLNSRNKTQSILVSGESGAGKTQTTKYIMKYFSYLSGKNSKNSKNVNTKVAIEEIILESNPILESFGNSKTRRNENSSRFGKYIKIFLQDNMIIGAKIDTYLLETIRLINHHPDELNFHIIYSIRDHFNKEANEPHYNYATESNIKPYFDYQTTVRALEVMNFKENIIDEIIKLIIALLHLGNCYSNHNHNYDHNYDNHNHDNNLTKSSEALGLRLEDLTETLTSRRRKIGSDIITSNLSEIEIVASRDTLAKALYGSLFNYLVEYINKSIQYNPLDKQSIKPVPVRINITTPLAIGILDIFGFEVFDQNGFEQLSINYTNERLQCLFNNEMIQAQQKEYQLEGLSWESISFTGNEICLTELDNNIFPMLDEATQLASSGDKEFISRLKNNNKYDYLLFPKQDPAPYFTVKHFAGPVNYQVGTLTERNADAVHPQLIELLNTSSKPFILELATRIPKGVVSSLAFKSISYQFRQSLHNLINELKLSDLHYIRCLKPNDNDLANNFNRHRIVEQLRYSGVLEAVKVSRAGFPIRMMHNEYISRYNKISTFNIPKKGVVKGNTKFFIKNSAYIELEKQLSLLKNTCATKIQSAIRRYLAIGYYQVAIYNIIKVQSQYRCYQAKRLLLRHKESRIIQTFWRSYFTHRQYKSFYQQVVSSQTYLRHFLAKRLKSRLLINRFISRHLLRFQTKKQNRASIFITGFFRKYGKRQRGIIEKAQKELYKKTEELETVLEELTERRKDKERQNNLIKTLEKQTKNIQEQQKLLEVTKRQSQLLHKKCKKQEEKNKKIIKENTELQEDIKLMQDSVRRNNSTKLHVLGEMEILMQENMNIKNRLDQYDSCLKSINNLNNVDQKCSIQ